MPDIEDVPLIEKPPIAVTPTAWQGVAIALVLAMCTAYGVASNLLIYASTRDIAGLIVYLRGNDFLQGISAVSIIVGIGGLIYRSLRRKARELFLERNVPSSVAYLKGGSDDPGASGTTNYRWSIWDLLFLPRSTPPLTRARETTTAPVHTRLVDGAVLLHAGGGMPIAPLDLHPTDVVVDGQRVSTTLEGVRYGAGTPISDLGPRVLSVADVAALNTPDAIRARDQAVGPGNGSPEFLAAYDRWARRADADIDVAFKDFLTANGWVWDGKSWGRSAEDDGLPSIDMDAFDANYAAWMVEGGKGSFGDFLIARGWSETGGKWSPPGLTTTQSRTMPGAINSPPANRD